MRKTIVYGLAVAGLVASIAGGIALNSTKADAAMDDGMHEFMKKALNCMSLMVQAKQGDPRDARYYNAQYISCLNG